MIIAIYDFKIKGFPEIIEEVICRKRTPIHFSEKRFPMSDITLEFIYVGF